MSINTITVNTDYTQPKLDLTKTVTIGPLISNYDADYLMIHFDELLRREIDSNPDVIYNGLFQEFMNMFPNTREF